MTPKNELVVSKTAKGNRDRMRVSAPMSRSENMSRIRNKDTAPEMQVRRALWRAGLRYRLHDKKLPGTPDLVFVRIRTAIFVQGCFWHSHEGCKNFRIPKTRTEWWTAKLARNKERDAVVRSELQLLGWQSLVLWECEIDDKDALEKIARGLKETKSGPAH
jgi:DNA mismatch endonuclease, patch repair protein